MNVHHLNLVRNSIRATITEVTDKPLKLSSAIPNLDLVFEQTLHQNFALFTSQCPHIIAGLSWALIELDNGGFYVSLISQEPLFIQLPFAGKTKFHMKTESVCILANLYSFARLFQQFKSKQCSVLHDKLMDYAGQLPESSLIKFATLAAAFD